MPFDHSTTFGPFLVRSWQPGDRNTALAIIRQVLQEYSLCCEPEGSDRDVLEVETCYWAAGGEFWVVERDATLVGTAGYYPIDRGHRRGHQAVEIRKMYLLPEARGQGLGRYLLNTLEAAIQARGFAEIWIETASVLKEAVGLYEASGYAPASGAETTRCDRVYRKLLSSEALLSTGA